MVEGLRLQAMKIVRYYANSCFDRMAVFETETAETLRIDCLPLKEHIS